MSAEDQVFLFEGGSGEVFHRAVCRSLGFGDGHGSKSEVIEELEIRSQRYSRIIASKGPVCALTPAAKVAVLAGMRTLVDSEGVVHFFAPGERIPEELVAG